LVVTLREDLCAHARGVMSASVGGRDDATDVVGAAIILRDGNRRIGSTSVVADVVRAIEVKEGRVSIGSVPLRFSKRATEFLTLLMTLCPRCPKVKTLFFFTPVSTVG